MDLKYYIMKSIYEQTYTNIGSPNLNFFNSAFAQTPGNIFVVSPVFAYDLLISKGFNNNIKNRSILKGYFGKIGTFCGNDIYYDGNLRNVIYVKCKIK